MIQPELLAIPFARDATSGTKNDIPNDPSPTLPAQTATWTLGFPAVTMQPLAVGGIPPLGQDFNGVLNALSEHTVFQNGGGLYKFNQDFSTAVGGYPKGAILLSDDGSRIWQSLVDNNTQNFNGPQNNQWQALVSALTSITGVGALTGGGSLAENRTIDASAATKASLSRANTSLQPSNVSQSTGQSTTSIMSQKASTDNFPLKSEVSSTWGMYTSTLAFYTGSPTTGSILPGSSLRVLAGTRDSNNVLYAGLSSVITGSWRLQTNSAGAGESKWGLFTRVA